MESAFGVTHEISKAKAISAKKANKVLDKIASKPNKPLKAKHLEPLGFKKKKSKKLLAKRPATRGEFVNDVRSRSQGIL